MHIETNLVLETEGKKPIVYDVYHNGGHTPKPIVIFCHGYKGFKDWGAWNLVAEEFAKKEFFFLKFNFSHNGGTVDQPIDFPDLEAFAQNNYSKELENLERIIKHVQTAQKYADDADVTNISLIGHSRGGGIVLIKAEENNAVKRVITWAGVSDYKVRFKEGTEAFKKFKETGRMFVENGRTKQQMPHDWQFYEDFIANEERLTIQRAATNLDKPWLIIHGDSDTSVNVSEGKALHRWNPKSTLEIIKEADHVFGAKHPWGKKTLPKHLKKVVQLSSDFLK
ncbi:alpha/beta hydrolase family protein [Jejudonia soesokkakensis]|uniref:Alpha/beta hydrolase family protein n=1 Tax=Jejudonia soesokkakensis TaxID=1323432 RepID=A0ABW2MRC1_9FLAO